MFSFFFLRNRDNGVERKLSSRSYLFLGARFRIQLAGVNYYYFFGNYFRCLEQEFRCIAWELVVWKQKLHFCFRRFVIYFHFVAALEIGVVLVLFACSDFLNFERFIINRLRAGGGIVS